MGRDDRVDGRSRVVRAVNAEIAVVATRMESRSAGDAEAWIFLCECGRKGCAERVQLRLSEYGQLRCTPDVAILAEAHVIAKARGARQHATALRSDAAALRAQAQQIRKRYAAHDPTA